MLRQTRRAPTWSAPALCLIGALAVVLASCEDNPAPGNADGPGPDSAPVDAARDSSALDAPGSDASGVDAADDAASVDAAANDAAANDAAAIDAAAIDAPGLAPDAPRDAGPADAAASDASPPDAGPPVPRIAFASKRAGSYDLYLVGVDGTGLQRLTSDATAELYPAFSPDGARIAFASDRLGPVQVFVLDRATGGVALVSSGLHSASAPVFSADGGRLAVEGKLTETDSTEIHLLHLDGSPPVALTSAAGLDTGPAWSPDGATIYFVTQRAGPRQIWSMAPDGSGQAAIAGTSAILGKPAVSADGAALAFARTGAGGRSQIVIHALATGEQRTLPALDDSEPAFSPLEPALAVTSLRHGDPEILILRLTDGLELSRLTNDPAIDGAAAFEPPR